MTIDGSPHSEVTTPNVPDELLGELKRATWMQSFSLPSRRFPFQQIEPYQYSIRSGGLTWFYHDDGYYLAYADPNSVTADQELLATTLDRSGFGSTGSSFASPQPIGRFQSSLSHWNILPSETFGLVDRNGVYQASLKNQKIETILEMTIDELIMMPRLAGAGPTVVVMRGNRIHLLDMESSDPERELPVAVDDPEEASQIAPQPWPGILMKERHVIELPERWYPLQEEPPVNIWSDHAVFDLGDAGFQLTQFRHGDSAKSLRFSQNGQFTQSLNYSLSKPEAVSAMDLAIRAVLPPAFHVASAVFSLTPKLSKTKPVSSLGAMIAVTAVGGLIHSILGWFLTKMACARRCLTSKTTGHWCLMSILAGVITPLMVLCAYPRLAEEICAGCSKSIPVDAETCPHCAAAWQPPHRSGIEVFASM